MLYPEAAFTKAEALHYYARIAPTLLPHLQGRAMTLKRYPDGVAGPHAGALLPSPDDALERVAEVGDLFAQVLRLRQRLPRS